MNRLNAHLLAALLTTACGSAECPEPIATSETTGDEQTSSPPARVQPLSSVEMRVAPPGTATVAMLARGNNAFVARLVMEPGAAVPEHQDMDEEYIHVLEGHGTIWIDGVESEVTPGATIFMPAGSTVRYQNGDARMVALQVFAGPDSAAKYESWQPIETRPGAPPSDEVE